MSYIKSRKILQKFWQQIDYYRAIHSIKTAIACLVGLALVKYLDWPQGWWVPITIIVVMSAQTRFGGTLQKAYMRFLGTAAGLAIALLTLTFFDSNIIAIFVAIAVACLVFTYIASAGGNISYAGVLGGVTTVLILAGPQAGYYFALQRGFYIVVGIIIALLVSRFVFPMHARERLRVNVADTLHNLRKLYFVTVQRKVKHAPQKAEKELENELINLIREQPQLIEEASLGSRYFSQHKKKPFKEIYNIERRLYRLINLMDESLSEAGEFVETMHKIENIEAIHVAIETGLDNLAENFITTSKMEPKLDFKDIANKLKLALQKFPATKDVQKLIGEHSFVFFMQQIIQEVTRLQKIATELNVLKK